MTGAVSIIVPTYDRPDSLQKTLAFLHAGATRPPIIVADGSSGAAAIRNAEICARDGVIYFRLPSQTGSPGADTATGYAGVLENYFARYRAALERVATPYVAVCGDDDLLLPGAAAEAAAFLDAHPDHVACHGVYLAFRYAGAGIQLDSVVYDGASIDGAEVGSRLMQMLARYEAPYYGVYRTAVQREIVAAMSRVTISLFFELYHSSASAVKGKIKRLETIYYLRNMGDAPHARPVEGWSQWAATDLDLLFTRYGDHRQRIIDLVSADPAAAISGEQLRRAIDMSFLLYAGRHFHLNVWVEEYLQTAIVDPAERDRLRLWLLFPDHGRPKPVPLPTLWVRAWRNRIVLGLWRRARRVLAIIGIERAVTVVAEAIARARSPVAAPPAPAPIWITRAGAHHTEVRLAPALVERFPEAAWHALLRRDGAVR